MSNIRVKHKPEPPEQPVADSTPIPPSPALVPPQTAQEALETPLEAMEWLTTGTTPIEGLGYGWRGVDYLTPALFTQIFLSYSGVLCDEVPWWKFATLLAENYLYVNPAGWLLVERPVHGGSVEIHGGKWAHIESAYLEEINNAMFAELHKHYPAIVALVGDDNSPARLYMKRLGFSTCGVMPMRTSFHGIPHNNYIMVKWRDG